VPHPLQRMLLTMCAVQLMFHPRVLQLLLLPYALDL
jgi:hypothetical protein